MVSMNTIRSLCITILLFNSVGSALLLNRKSLCLLKYEDASNMRGCLHTTYSPELRSIYKSSMITEKFHEPVQNIEFERDRYELRDAKKPRAARVPDCLRPCREQGDILEPSNIRSRSSSKVAHESSATKDGKTFFSSNLKAVNYFADDAGDLTLRYVSGVHIPHQLQDANIPTYHFSSFYNRPRRLHKSDSQPKPQDISNWRSLKAQIFKYLKKPGALFLFPHPPVTKRYNGATMTGSPTTWIEYQKSSAPVNYSKLHSIRVIIFSIIGIFFWCSICAWAVWRCMMCVKKRKAKRAERKMNKHVQGQSIEQADEMAMVV